MQFWNDFVVSFSQIAAFQAVWLFTTRANNMFFNICIFTFHACYSVIFTLFITAAGKVFSIECRRGWSGCRRHDFFSLCCLFVPLLIFCFISVFSSLCLSAWKWPYKSVHGIKVLISVHVAGHEKIENEKCLFNNVYFTQWKMLRKLTTWFKCLLWSIPEACSLRSVKEITERSWFLLVRVSIYWR